MKEVTDNKEKQSRFEKFITGLQNAPEQLLTPEYIYDKGIKLYSYALELFDSNKSEQAVQKKFIQAIKYLQAATILGKLEACFVVYDFYHKDYLKLVTPEAANLVSIIGYKLSEVAVPESAKYDNYENLEKLAFKKVEFINETKATWGNPPISNSLKETHYLKPLIAKFNNGLPENCKLISKAKACKELNNAIDDFAIIELVDFNKNQEDKTENDIETIGKITNIDSESCCFWL